MDLKEIKKFIPIKSQEHLSSCKIDHRLCSYKENYIVGSKHNMTTRWWESNNPTHNSEPQKKLNLQHPTYLLLDNLTSKHTWTRKNLKVIHIALLRPSLYNKLKFNKPLLYRNGITNKKDFHYSLQKKFINGKKNFLFNFYYSFGNAEIFCFNRILLLPSIICNLHWWWFIQIQKFMQKSF